MSFGARSGGDGSGAGSWSSGGVRDGEGKESFESQIRDCIQTLQQNLRNLNEQLDRCSQSNGSSSSAAGAPVSERAMTQLSSALKTAQNDVKATEEIFRRWMALLSSDPAERQKRKFSVEKLTRHFNNEVSSLRAASRRVAQAESEFRIRQTQLQARKEARAAGPGASAAAHAGGVRKGIGGFGPSAAAGAAASASASASSIASRGGGAAGRREGVDVDLTGMADNDDADFFADDGDGPESEECGLLMHEEVTTDIARERTQGITRISQSVSEVNQIFRDLAEIVTSQGAAVDTIESNVSHADEQAKGAERELRKAHAFQKASRDRNCTLLGALLVCLFLVILSFSSSGSASVSSSASSSSSSSSSAPVVPPLSPVLTASAGAAVAPIASPLSVGSRRDAGGGNSAGTGGPVAFSRTSLRGPSASSSSSASGGQEGEDADGGRRREVLSENGGGNGEPESGGEAGHSEDGPPLLHSEGNGAFIDISASAPPSLLAQRTAHSTLSSSGRTLPAGSFLRQGGNGVAGAADGWRHVDAAQPVGRNGGSGVVLPAPPPPQLSAHAPDGHGSVARAEGPRVDSSTHHAAIRERSSSDGKKRRSSRDHPETL
uniref:t-SNARE coiled-coil homology domain-containing protein n=1 Tax=Chromera velia CCMP2878 TaxID=1169474 RepID=A0A0G4HKC7_9ALVE|eukprot:Cvel_28592.t1-p1 / transcript=Cvel_28592.t1 / gene=Cvel_28592 / organism=Chromera_velia_CCMP2878 / gene_product=Syntaxin VAM3, putative / transcript_product=Syntaxin VAM3, putative / location=Cvel_scaffold3771:5302-9244(+) / protein_length=605 / sequence_SO=supercontig / SO=protein_coding / is_pseudo=false